MISYHIWWPIKNHLHQSMLTETTTQLRKLLLLHNLGELDATLIAALEVMLTHSLKNSATSWLMILTFKFLVWHQSLAILISMLTVQKDVHSLCSERRDSENINSTLMLLGTEGSTPLLALLDPDQVQSSSELGQACSNTEERGKSSQYNH